MYQGMDFGYGGTAPTMPGFADPAQLLMEDLQRRAAARDPSAIRLLAQLQTQMQNRAAAGQAAPRPEAQDINRLGQIPLRAADDAQREAEAAAMAQARARGGLAGGAPPPDLMQRLNSPGPAPGALGRAATDIVGGGINYMNELAPADVPPIQDVARRVADAMPTADQARAGIARGVDAFHQAQIPQVTLPPGVQDSLDQIGQFAGDVGGGLADTVRTAGRAIGDAIPPGVRDTGQQIWDAMGRARNQLPDVGGFRGLAPVADRMLGRNQQPIGDEAQMAGEGMPARQGLGDPFAGTPYPGGPGGAMPDQVPGAPPPPAAEALAALGPGAREDMLNTVSPPPGVVPPVQGAPGGVPAARPRPGGRRLPLDPPGLGGQSPGLLPELTTPEQAAAAGAQAAMNAKAGGPADDFTKMLQAEAERLGAPAAGTDREAKRHSGWGADLVDLGSGILASKGRNWAQRVGIGAQGAARGAERRTELDERRDERGEARQDKRIAVLTAAQTRLDAIQARLLEGQLNREQRDRLTREGHQLRREMAGIAAIGAAGNRAVTNELARARIDNLQRDNQRAIDADTDRLQTNAEKQILDRKKATIKALLEQAEGAPTAAAGDELRKRARELSLSADALTPEEQLQIDKRIIETYGPQSTRGRVIARRDAVAEINRVNRDSTISDEQKKRRIQGIADDYRRDTGLDLR